MNAIPPCHDCGGTAGLEALEVFGEGRRWRVRCGKCGRMTPHFGTERLALAVWGAELQPLDKLRDNQP